MAPPGGGNTAGVSTLRRLWFGLIIIATLAYYFWTAMTSPGGPPRIHGRESDHFNLLSRGLRNGHLHLDQEVPAGLLQARNPYDPKARPGVAVLHDASFYQGKYYIYFGPAPVVTLLLPFSLVTGSDLPVPYAVWLYSSFGYAALLGLFFFLQRRHFPAAGLLTMTAALIALGGASLVVTLLRRAHIWELSGASGFAFFSATLYCLGRALHSSSRATAWATLGGLMLGLAVASRPTYLLCSVLFALPLVLRPGWIAGRNGYTWRALTGAAIPCTLIVAVLLAYNYARFGSPLEFGLRYQLTSVIESESRHFSLSYVPFNFHVYFLSTLRWIGQFPFVNGIALPPLPPGHGGHEYTFGLLPNLPFSLFSFVVIAGLLLGRFRRALPEPLRLTLGVLIGAVVINAALLLVFFGSCIRYMVDFTPWVMLLAALGLLAGERELRTAFALRLWRAAALGLALVSSFTAAAGVVNFYDLVRGEPSLAYRPVARALNRPVHWLQQQRWPEYGPREIAFTLPADRTPRQEVLVTLERDGRQTAVVFVDTLNDRKIRFGYRESARPKTITYSPAVFAPAGASATLRLSIGGPYAEFNGVRGRLRAQFDGVPFWDVPVVGFDVYPGKLTIGPDATSPDLARFSGTIEAVRPIVMPEIARPLVAGIRARVDIKPEMVGRAYPLVTTGQTKAGDLFFIRVHDNRTITFGYDHWGDATIVSPPVPTAPGETRVVEFWVPALSTAEANPILLVKVDGVTVWEQPAAAYPVTPETIFVGRNPIGGSTCELTIEHTVFEDLQLPLAKR